MKSNKIVNPSSWGGSVFSGNYNAILWIYTLTNFSPFNLIVTPQVLEKHIAGKPPSRPTSCCVSIWGWGFTPCPALLGTYSCFCTSESLLMVLGELYRFPIWNNINDHLWFPHSWVTWGARNWTPISHLQGKCPACCTISVSPKASIKERKNL